MQLKTNKLSVIDRKSLGDEPKVTKASSVVEMIVAYNWMNYFFTSEDAKEFVIQYLKIKHMDKTLIENIDRVDAIRLINVGWNCRLLLSDNELPIDIETKMWHKIHSLAVEAQQKNTQVTNMSVPSVQTYVANKSNKIIASLDEQLDIICNTEQTEFDIQDFFRNSAVKPQIAKQVVEYYKPIYSEVYDAIHKNDPDLKYAYRNWSKKGLKLYLKFLNDIITTADVTLSVVQPRKPRKKKVKPASQLVSKVKFQQKDTTFKIESIKPTDIVGATQLWLFNTKYRTLSVLNAMGHTGLSVKGTTVNGFDEKTSITKKLRKPEGVLKDVMDSGKVHLRKIMDTIKCKPNTATGRINSDTIILRAVK